MDQKTLAEKFTTHEAVCAERWKTVFNKLEEFDERSSQRYEEHKNEFHTYRKLALSSLGLIVMFLLGLLASGGLQ